jgi:hypothetical protein
LSTDRLVRQQFAFTASIRDPDNHPVVERVEPRRMKIYQDLFYNNVEDFLASSFPVTKRLWKGDEWQRMIREFLKQHRAQSPLFLDMPLEFMDFIQARGQNWLSRKPFLLELLHYEWIELSVWLADDGPEEGTAVWSEEHCPVINHAARLLAYQWPVHRISEEFEPSEDDAASPTFLLVHREDEDVRFTLLTAATWQFLSLCNGENSLQTLTEHFAENLAVPSGQLTEMLYPVLREFHEKDALRFVTPGGATTPRE